MLPLHNTALGLVTTRTVMHLADVHVRSLWDKKGLPGVRRGSISASLAYHASAIFMCATG